MFSKALKPNRRGKRRVYKMSFVPYVSSAHLREMRCCILNKEMDDEKMRCI